MTDPNTAPLDLDGLERDIRACFVKPDGLRDRALAAVQQAREAERMRGAALSDIAAERRRQMEVEGWSLAHDDEHERGEMALAAACYAAGRIVSAIPQTIDSDRGAAGYRSLWPWDMKWWKPKAYRTNLVRAAALIVAEIERLDRRQALAPATGGGDA